MKKKIIGIFVMTLMITTTLPAVGTMDVGKDQVMKGTVANAGSDWYIEVVDSEGDVGLYTNIDFRGWDDENDGGIGTAYYDKTNGDLKYAEWDGESWDIETVDSEGDVGLYSSLALDSDGNSHIAYYDKTNGDLKYAVWNGESWNIETVDSEGNVGGSISIAYDEGSDDLAFSYYDFTNNKLKYATLNEEGWDITVLDDGGEYCSMAVSSNGRPYIAYAGEDGGLEVTWYCYDVHGFLHKDVDSRTGVCGISLDIDSSNNLYISYYVDGMVNVANGNPITGSFTIETVDSVGEEKEPISSIIYDPGSDDLAFSYYDSPITLKYARKTITDDEWEIQVVDSEGDVGYYSSLCVINGCAVIAYYDATNGDLKRAVEVFQEVWVDDDANPGWYDTTHAKTIQEGLNVVSSDGNVYLHPGVYYENVIWPDKQGVKLLSLEGLESTIIDGGGNDDVIYASDVDGAFICGFTIQNGGRHGIFFDGCKNCCICSCHICGNEAHGIYLNECDDCDTSSCCGSPDPDVDLPPCNDDPTEIDKNGKDGIHQDDSDGCDVGPCLPDTGECCPELDEGCAPPEVHDNGEDGIHLDGICDCHVIADVYQNGKYGYILVISKGGKIIGTPFYEYPKEEKEECRNVYDNGEGGISLEDSHNCIIGGINIYGHDEGYGVYIDASSSNNLMFHNNFTNNMQNAFDEGLNTWDNGFLRGGNHWDDYTGTDGDGDGIGDTPYPIPSGSNQDNYPLMEPWSGNGDNQPPNNPTINGPTNGKVETTYEYTFSATDVDEDKVYYYIEWGDDAVEEWIGPYDPGEEVTISHTWAEQGTYTIRAKAKDAYNNESDWGTLSVSMPKNKPYISTPFLQLLHNFLQNHPIRYQLLQRFLRL